MILKNSLYNQIIKIEKEIDQLSHYANELKKLYATNHSKIREGDHVYVYLKDGRKRNGIVQIVLFETNPFPFFRYVIEPRTADWRRSNRTTPYIFEYPEYQYLEIETIKKTS